MHKTSDEERQRLKDGIREWEEELKRLQTLIPVQNLRNQLKLKDLPVLENDLKSQEDAYSGISETAEEVLTLLEMLNEICPNYSLGSGETRRDKARPQRHHDIEGSRKDYCSLAIRDIACRRRYFESRK